MKPRRTHNSNLIFTLPGGNEDNDLWAYDAVDENDNPVICSVWVPSDREREAIARGENIRLIVWSERNFMPGVTLDLSDEPLGKRPEE